MNTLADDEPNAQHIYGDDLRRRKSVLAVVTGLMMEASAAIDLLALIIAFAAGLIQFCMSLCLSYGRCGRFFHQFSRTFEENGLFYRNFCSQETQFNQNKRNYWIFQLIAGFELQSPPFVGVKLRLFRHVHIISNEFNILCGCSLFYDL